MATSFIGQRISLLSHSDVRYLGTLDGLDPASATIKLKNVFSMGTEDRRPPDESIAPLQKPYQYIIFQAVEVKDLWLDNTSFEPRPPSVHDDPAVIGVSDPAPYVAPEPDYDAATIPAGQAVPQSLGTRPPAQSTGTAPPPVASPDVPLAQRVQQQQQQGDSAAARAGGISRHGNASVNSVHSATQSLENVERALGDLRLQNAQYVGTTNGGSGGRQNGRRNNGGGGGANGRAGPTTVQPAPITIPLTEFDFQSANARFKKSSGRLPGADGDDGDDSDTRTNPSDEEDEDEETESKTSSSKVAKDDKTSPAYNPKASFFDSLSSNVTEQHTRGGRGGGRGNRSGRGMGRSRREEEREKNVATFGEPGGLGLMGPDAYVGGYGGSNRGRRGGRGGRRGGPRRGNGNATANAIIQ